MLLLMCVTAIWASVAALHTPVIPGTPHAHPYNDGKVSSVWNVAEIIFTVLFIVEASLKILVYGWRLYWRDHRHRCVLEVTAHRTTVQSTCSIYN